MSNIVVPESTTAPTFKSAHFIGVGGAGMSGIALVLHERGYTVTGSDLKTSRYIRQLTRAGMDVRDGCEDHRRGVARRRRGLHRDPRDQPRARPRPRAGASRYGTAPRCCPPSATAA